MSVMPRATYRVQLRGEFPFSTAAEVVPYLAALGVSHLYCSPYLQAARGSAHGYDVVDPTRVSDELGGDSALLELDRALREHGMTQLLDIVPNHMCVTDPENRFWWDVLRAGRASEHARMFDIDWDAPGCDGRVVLPVLGDELERVLERGELTLERTDGDAVLCYYDNRFPLHDVPDGARMVDLELLRRQWYRLEFWRTGLVHVNYRRFFDVSSLAGVRQEDAAVFTLTHGRIAELVTAGTVQGLRVDHVDGLRDPRAYLRALRGLVPGAWILVEKILAVDEHLPGDWPVAGTTGYDATALLTSLQVDRTGLDALEACYAEFTGDATGFAEQSRAARRLVLHELLESEVARLARVANACAISEAAPALVELLAAMPVYRVYPDGWRPLDAEDATAVSTAARAAIDAGRCDATTVAQVVDVLLGAGEETPAREELRARFQQVSAAAIAKGVEDTTFYRFIPCVALNEVGSDPLHTTDVAQFHQACAERAERWPQALVATATHDTKRGEDARLRVAMLSEIPERWAETVRRLRVRAGAHRGTRAPSAAAEYLLYQTLVAAYPIDADRLCAYMQKAAREAKTETSWLNPDDTYEAELDAFVRGVLDDAAMTDEITVLLEAMTPAWHVASLSQLLLKCTMPGVPDVYQGCELWDLRLVDPDNRTPVDYAARREMLTRLDSLDADAVLHEMANGLPKLHVLRQALRVRADRASSFAPGAAHVPLVATGRAASHVVAFARGATVTSADVLTIAVRLPLSRGAWDDTAVALPPGRWHNVLTADVIAGGSVPMSVVTAHFPVGLFEAVA